VRDLISTQVEEHSILETQSAVSRGIQRTMFPVQVRETGDAQFTKEKTEGVELQKFFSCHRQPKFCYEAKQSLSEYGANYGPTTGASKPDYITFAKKKIRKHKLALMCIELKDTVFSPIEPLGQAFASGANIALSQKHFGLDPSKVAAPLITTNGQLYSFATASLLDNIPVLHVVSDVLDANKRSDMADIARMLAKVKTFIATKAIELQRCLLAVHTIPMPLGHRSRLRSTASNFSSSSRNVFNGLQSV